ncbi:MAG: ABC transporter ATP-binding protein [Acidobacteriota bacterium]
MGSEAAASNLVLAVRGLSKRYRLYQRPWDRLAERLPGARSRHLDFWALRDINFEVQRGEVFGVLGPNGAGKSTLLRILAGTSRATRGRAEIRGPRAALLELGAGFHPELTGRQNLLMSARLMGISGDEARLRLPEMIAFAELGRFIDQPVRTYSAGMVVRLGFAVASGFDPEVLILDEALAVGDTYFQRKSMRRITRFREEGKAILLVSHDLRLVGRFCNRALWLENGESRAVGEADQVRRAYESSALARVEAQLGRTGGRGMDVAAAVRPAPPAAGARWGRGPIRIIGVEMVGESGQPGWVFRLREKVELRLHCLFLTRQDTPVVSFQIHRADGVYVMGTSTSDNNVDFHPLAPQEGPICLAFRFEALHLHAGRYLLSVQAYTRPDEPFWSDPSDYYFQTHEFRVFSPYPSHGIVALPGRWEVREGASAAGLKRVVHPGEDGNEEFLYGEWHAPEGADPPFRWTGREGGVLLRREPGDRRLELITFLSRPDPEPLPVQVQVEGRLAGTLRIGPGGPTACEVEVPGEIKGDPVRVQLRPSQIWSPREYGLDDQRDLGVAVISVGWKQAARGTRGEVR